LDITQMKIKKIFEKTEKKKRSGER
jgi:hypothetical protein